ncbi:lymphocyte antigen 6E-like [Carettochelys insculpta]|uniref:lymphocyte antigen 6E-like n=1 Tax=Carettochelys insculpta TaxID=44489 RepID=UPI003EBB36B7
MKVFLMALLAAALCVEQGYSLMCYTCQNKTSNKDCLLIDMCAKEDNYCVTILDTIAADDKSMRRISKMCSPECPKKPPKQGKTGSKVFCCDKPLCNVNGAGSMKTSYSMISMGILANFIYIFRSGL